MNQYSKNEIEPWVTKLSHWFLKEKRNLPWRIHYDPYEVWLSEVMAQQTQIKTMLPLYMAFLKEFPNLKALAQAKEEDVLGAWSGLGYYSRARNLHKAAKIMVTWDSWKVDPYSWENLPGIGPYTASAVLSIAFNQAFPILDGNIKRVISRLFQIEENLWEKSKECLDLAVQNSVEPRVFNQALMELGALVCKPKNPNCSLCPIATICHSSKSEAWRDYPRPKVKKQWVQIQEKVIVRYAKKESKNSKVLYLELIPSLKWRMGTFDFPEAPLELETEPCSFMLKSTVTHHKILRKHYLKELDFLELKNPISIESTFAMGSLVKKAIQKIREMNL